MPAKRVEKKSVTAGAQGTGQSPRHTEGIPPLEAAEAQTHLTSHVSLQARSCVSTAVLHCLLDAHPVILLLKYYDGIFSEENHCTGFLLP